MYQVVIHLRLERKFEHIPADKLPWLIGALVEEYGPAAISIQPQPPTVDEEVAQ